MSKDYYKILGINKDASQDEIRSAYKKLAKKFHPDVSKEENAKEKFQEILEAYSVLNDPQKRQQYDTYGSAGPGFGPGGFQGFGNFEDLFRQSRMEFDFEDLFKGFGFEDFFGSNRRRQGPRKGTDIQYNLKISFNEAVFGSEKTIDIDRIDSCEKCNGSGSHGKAYFATCQACQGRGVIIHSRRTPFGLFQTQTTCRNCQGEGKKLKNPCKECNGQGRTHVRKKIDVKIPEGINNGDTLRLQGQGHAGEIGARHGDLYVTVFVEPHDFFKRDNSDIYCEIPISFTEAALGTEIKIPTLKGKAKLKIPEATQTGTIFKLKNQGIKKLNKQEYGDQFVKVIVETPKNLNKKQKELLKELAGEETEKERKGFFDKLFDAFN